MKKKENYDFAEELILAYLSTDSLDMALDMCARMSGTDKNKKKTEVVRKEKYDDLDLTERLVCLCIKKMEMVGSADEELLLRILDEINERRAENTKDKDSLVNWCSSVDILLRLYSLPEAFALAESMADERIKKCANDLKSKVQTATAGRDDFSDFARKTGRSEMRTIADIWYEIYSGKRYESNADIYIKRLRNNMQKKNNNLRKKLIRGGICMAVAGTTLVAMVAQGAMYFDKLKEERLQSAMSHALYVTVDELYASDKSDAEKDGDQNRMLAVFLQAMLAKVDDDVDLTVRVCEKDDVNKAIEVEAIGEYSGAFRKKHRVEVRRRIAF